jgi:hypothetical protein
MQLARRTCRFGVLAPDSETPKVPQSAVRTNLFQPFEVISKFRVDCVRQDLRVFAVNNVFLPVKEPCRNFELSRILDNGDDTLEFIRIEVSSAEE